MKDPKSFWKRLSGRSVIPALDTKSLVSFLEKLYYCPSADDMPQYDTSYPIFSENEVQSELKRLCNEKSEDLKRLLVELLKWDNDSLMVFVTKMLNDAIHYEFLPSLTVRKIIPIHKSGRKK